MKIAKPELRMTVIPTARTRNMRKLAEELIIAAHLMDRGYYYDTEDLNELAEAIRVTLTE